ncbi:MAG: DUF2141 domain-containing protein [Spirochaetales bacterium]|nr:DUF2141 domain-containing protein [Spirochaetales bacterium]
MRPFRGMPHRATSLVMFIITLVMSQNVSAAELKFRITGIDVNRGGTILAGLYASEDTYPKPGYEVAGLVLPVQGDQIVASFEDLPPGNYVIGLLHDEDQDLAMDYGFLGIPLEGYGFSGTKNAPLFPPQFRQVAFDLESNDVQTTEIQLKYL